MYININNIPLKHRSLQSDFIKPPDIKHIILCLHFKSSGWCWWMLLYTPMSSLVSNIHPISMQTKHSQHSAPPRILPFKKKKMQKTPKHTLQEIQALFLQVFWAGYRSGCRNLPISLLSARFCPSPGRGFYQHLQLGNYHWFKLSWPIVQGAVPGCHQQGHSAVLWLPKQHKTRKNHSKGNWKFTPWAWSHSEL